MEVLKHLLTALYMAVLIILPVAAIALLAKLTAWAVGLW